MRLMLHRVRVGSSRDSLSFLAHHRHPFRVVLPLRETACVSTNRPFSLGAESPSTEHTLEPPGAATRRWRSPAGRATRRRSCSCRGECVSSGSTATGPAASPASTQTSRLVRAPSAHLRAVAIPAEAAPGAGCCIAPSPPHDETSSVLQCEATEHRQ